jgi:hypothetical protein
LVPIHGFWFLVSGFRLPAWSCQLPADVPGIPPTCLRVPAIALIPENLLRTTDSLSLHPSRACQIATIKMIRFAGSSTPK